MPGSEGLLLKRSTSSYRKQILSDLHYGKVLDFYVSTTLIKYLLRWIHSRKGIRNNRNFLYVPQQSLYSTKCYIIRDLFLRASWRSAVPWYWNPSVPEPIMAGSFSSSSRIWLLPQSTYFSLEWQFIRVVQKPDSRRLGFYSIQAIGLEG